MAHAAYFFVPVARRGLARGITAAPASGKLRVAASFSLELQADKTGGGIDTPTLMLPAVELYGPGDIVGFDERMIVRRDPRPNVGDYEPNYLPAVEFADADFPWRFTPDIASSKGLTPWLTLIVLATDDAIERQEPPVSKGALRHVMANVQNLPDLTQAWRWAHVMITGSSDDKIDAQQAIARGEADPDHLVSRIVCSRHLAQNTRYTAYLVPTFEAGRLAGLGKPPSGASSATAFSWTVPPRSAQPANPPAMVDLPYYAKWEFSTGARGDFEYLVRLLVPRVMHGLGKRDMVVADPGYGVPSVSRSDPKLPHTLSLEGALHSFDFVPTDWAQDHTPASATSDAVRPALAKMLNTPSVDALSQAAMSGSQMSGVLHASDSSKDPLSSKDPVVGPPIYGRWHAAQQFVSPGAAAWCDTLNLDPRHRAAAGYGALIIQRLQESLMASAWQQLGAVEKMNALIRSAQLGREASAAIFRRLTRLASGPFVRIMSPVSHKVRLSNASGAGTSVSGAMAASVLPRAALDGAFRRIARLRGPVRKRQLARPEVRSAFLNQPDVLVRVGNTSLAAAGAPATKMAGIADITVAAFGKDRTYTPTTPVAPRVMPIAGPIASTSGAAGATPAGVPAPVVGPVPTPSIGAVPHATPTVGSLTPPASATPSVVRFSEADLTETKLSGAIAALNTVAPSVLRIWGSDLPQAQSAAAETLNWLNAQRPEPTNTIAAPVTQAAASFRKSVDPAFSIAARLQKRVRLTGVANRSDALAPIMAAPEFPQAMYEPLREISQDLVLPGLDRVPQNTLSLLQVNMRFIESYHCGLNHEMAAELLWREYPTDQRGSYFRQFFQVVDAVDAAATGTGEPGAVPESMKDITRLHTWGKTALGSHNNRPIPPIVLLIRGDLLKKYPNTMIYAVPARRGSQGRYPDLEGYVPQGVTPSDDSVRKFPVIAGSLSPDVTFFGFLLTEDEIRGKAPIPEGYYFVLEERVSEPRFGIDEPAPGQSATGSRSIKEWDDLAWTDLSEVAAGCYIDGALPRVTLSGSGPTWDDTSATSSASIASVLLQDPVRVAVHGDKMLPPKQS